jgi:hypothetical protein
MTEAPSCSVDPTVQGLRPAEIVRYWGRGSEKSGASWKRDGKKRSVHYDAWWLRRPVLIVVGRACGRADGGVGVRERLFRVGAVRSLRTTKQDGAGGAGRSLPGVRALVVFLLPADGVGSEAALGGGLVVFLSQPGGGDPHALGWRASAQAQGGAVWQDALRKACTEERGPGDEARYLAAYGYGSGVDRR